MTETPLSDAMTAHADSGTPESYDRFIALFRASTVGVLSDNLPEPEGRTSVTSAGDIRVSSTAYGDGRDRIMTFADPEVFLRTYGPRFNAGIAGEVLLRMAAASPNGHGVLVNCATREISLLISKETAQALCAPPGDALPRRPWWKRR
ncbi:hypothetical protein Cme02nite_07610 [Catellatospora methionotrophica]|uniref:SseB protein N-terminal domain-containing protein n=1 Tax=Catellatospora methionotrophica TaxID=121620 RepID=A0A8J3LB46_9ACTN|nr:hypothetical protein [Catellatospora methionotrophica]GIG12429.1 hypothetical protein Cme02nite_07610 [Catellatospora methionotrophica]